MNQPCGARVCVIGTGEARLHVRRTVGYAEHKRLASGVNTFIQVAEAGGQPTRLWQRVKNRLQRIAQGNNTVCISAGECKQGFAPGTRIVKNQLAIACLHQAVVTRPLKTEAVVVGGPETQCNGISLAAGPVRKAVGYAVGWFKDIEGIGSP